MYCIIASKEAQSFGPLGIGGRADELHTICFTDIAAVVSNSPIISYSVARDNVLPYERAIEEIMKKYTVLPVRFNTIVENEEKIKRILEKEHGRFLDLLNKMEGKKELSLKVIFKEEAVYKDILGKYEDIRMSKQKMASLPSQKTYSQRMEIGRMVELALQKEREIYKKDILDGLAPLAADVKMHNPYGELMIINAAFLVEKDQEAEFDRKVNDLSGKYGEKVKFRYVGTLPPFNFVTLVIETEKY
jgi:hypothetical protein